MIKTIVIRNFKSIAAASLDLGNVNVFIGANGAGKSNILEAVGMVASERASSIEVNILAQKGVRIAKPDLMVSSFYGLPSHDSIDVEILGTEGERVQYHVMNPSPEDIYSTWKVTCSTGAFREGADKEMISKKMKELRTYVSNYLIYSLSVDALRGFTSDSMQYPLGINGEGLDVLLNNLPKEEIALYFPEMLKVSDNCRFTPCTHTHEPGCAVKEAVESGDISYERYSSYLGMLEEENKYRR